jgi:hypothetical protein
MAKYRHLVGNEVALTGYGVVGPFAVFETTLDLTSSPNFEVVLEPEVFETPLSIPDPEPVVVTKKKNPEPVEAPPADAPSEG